MSKKGLVAGAMILTAANLITRFLGFFYRIFMSNTIGPEGMGLYQLIMPIYMLAWTITSSGFTTTISKLTAQENAKKQYGNIGRILKHSLCLCVGISILVSIALFTFADFIGNSIIKDSRTILSLQLLCFCIPFMSAGSCIRGYFFGMQDTVVPALSQVFEQTIRITVVFALAGFLIPLGLEYACAAAVIGIAFGEVLSFVFVFFSYLFFKKKNRLNKRPTMSPIQTVSILVSMSIPLTANRMIGSLLSTAENVLIPQRLQLFGASANESMRAYGSLTGMAMPLIQFPSALLVAISTTLVPAISEASAVGQKKRIQYTVSRSFLFTAITSFGVAGVFAVFPNEICAAVYHDPALGKLLLPLALLCPFMYLQITLSGILNGLGKQMFLLCNSVLSSIINIIFIYFFIPQFGTDAFIAGWFFSLLITVLISFYLVTKEIKLRIAWGNWFGKPILSIAAAGLLTRLLFLHLAPTNITYILCAVLMTLLYFLFILLTGCLRKEDISILKGKKPPTS